MADDRDDAIAAFVRARADPAAGDGTAEGEVARFWADLDGAAADPALQAMLAGARSRLGDATVVPLRRRIRAPLITALAASLLAAIGIGGWFAFHQHPATPVAASQMLTNGAAAPRTFRLADGSAVTLDAQTALEVPAWTGERRVAMIRGRAFFKVVHDSAHPFVVMASGNRIMDLGTAFSVGTDGSATVVILVEGAVRVQTARAAAIDLKPNDALTLPTSGSYRLANIDAAAQNEWRDGRITFDNQPAAVVLERMNRYFANDITLANPSDGQMAISGTFRLDERTDVLRALTAMGLRTTTPEHASGS